MFARNRDADVPMRLINFPTGINGGLDTGSLVRLDTTVFFYVGKGSCEIIAWLAPNGAGVELDKSVVYQAFSRFMKQLTKETKLRKIGFSFECRDPMVGSIVCRYVADMPTLKFIYDSRVHTRSFSMSFDRSLWHDDDRKRCAFYLYRNTCACHKILCSDNTPLSLWPHLLDSLHAKTKGGHPLAASVKYYLIREGLTGLMDLRVSSSNEESDTAGFMIMFHPHARSEPTRCEVLTVITLTSGICTYIK